MHTHARVPEPRTSGRNAQTHISKHIHEATQEDIKTFARKRTRSTTAHRSRHRNTETQRQKRSTSPQCQVPRLCCKHEYTHVRART
eukprot:3587187-Pleurochrysis_carterae.AAC.2